MSPTEKAIKDLEESMRYLQMELDKFVVRFQENPHHALEWDTSVFDWAARLSVYKRLHGALSDLGETTTLETLREYAIKQVIQGARFPSCSSSASANRAHQCELKAWATVIEPNGVLFSGY